MSLDVDLLLSHLHSNLDGLNNTLPALDDEKDLTVVAEVLTQLRARQKQLGDLEAIVAARLAQRMPRNILEWSGYKAVRKEAAGRVTWYHDDVAQAVATDAMVDPATGEMPSDEVQRVVWQVVGAIKNCVSPRWLVTPLRARGLDVSELRTVEPGRRIVAIERVAEGEAAA